ncbi:unnamed protein product (macronuclear) [Paramecium tetraurelia]|uniref:Peptidase A1 domain-containing protein n=1 Tax=Paramecium tetraurelia TaxID=5888 RepID=A0BFW7_PARTE|nr:uncharacterized protein GSPATT00028469001 [Paramecium tetraurelia]CAK57434.1 unnamed protein product [Paramecium tetraurelia]|eukprot:XP_001424832.1 hypothetical protein (macronuclear) [Paramecium tetraurelia strain d4-2]
MLKTQLNEYNSYFTSLFHTNGQTLISFFQLYTYLRNKTQTHLDSLNPKFDMNYGGINAKIPKSIQSKRIGAYNTTISCLCYTNTTKFHQPYTHEELINIKTQESMQSFGMVIFQGKTTLQSFLYGYVKRDNILMTYPCLQRHDIANYIPENRTWYIEAKRNFQAHKVFDKYNFSITYPYLLFKSTSVGLSMAIPFVDRNLSFIGTGAFDLIPSSLLKEVTQQFGRDFTSIFLASLDGILIMHPFNITFDKIPLYFYNQSITGFGLEDWQGLSDPLFKSNCQNQTTTMDFKCLYNSFYNQDMFVSQQILHEFNMSVIVLVSSSEFNKFSDEFNSNLISKLQITFSNSIIEQASLFVFLCFLIYFMISYLFYPIELIINAAMNQIQKKKYQNKNLNTILQSLLSVQILDLYRSCQHFNKLFERLSFNKNEQCQKIENLQYPQQIEEIKLCCFVDHKKFRKLDVLFLVKKIVQITKSVK